MVKIGINGLGVMGRYLIRAIQKEFNEGKLYDKEIEVAAFNDLAPAEQLAPLLAHDSVYLGFPGKVERSGNDIIVNGETIKGSTERDPSNLHWDDLGVDVIYESTGVWVKAPRSKEGKETLDKYLETKGGAKKIIYSAPSSLAEVTIVMGVNDEMYKGQKIISNASCTTNCLAAVAKALHDKYDTFTGLMTTIHAYTSDQNLQDGPHKDMARAYAAALNFVPTTTGAARAVGLVIPELDGKLNGMAIRGPVAVGSIVDLVANLGKEVSSQEVNKTMREAAEGYLKGTLEYRDGPIVSSMVLGNSTPSVFDAKQTMTNGNLVKVLSYYDNVSGFSHQAIKLIKIVGK